MKYLVFLALVAIVNCDIKEEDDVLLLTGDNWNEAVTSDVNILVQFCKFQTLFLVSLEMSDLGIRSCCCMQNCSYYFFSVLCLHEYVYLENL